MKPHLRSTLSRAAAVVLLASAAGIACSRSSIPILIESDLLPSTLTAAAGVTRTPIYVFTPGPGYQFPHAVLGVPEGETLTLRQVAGVSGGGVGTFAHNQRGLQLTGNATNLGSSLWLEVFQTGGGSGWVPALNLTQDVAGEAFCADPRLAPLVDEVRRAIAEGDGAGLQAAVSPRRGLTLRYDWWNPEILIRTEDVAGLFDSQEPIEWGTQLSGGPIHGTFAEVILPHMERVVRRPISWTCNETVIGPALREARWPSEYVNLNYVSLYSPADPGEAEYAWTTWLVGIEYVDNQPYVSHLVQLRAGI